MERERERERNVFINSQKGEEGEGAGSSLYSSHSAVIGPSHNGFRLFMFTRLDTGDLRCLPAVPEPEHRGRQRSSSS